jgi:DNA-binding NtrC family response regulator
MYFVAWLSRGKNMPAHVVPRDFDRLPNEIASHLVGHTVNEIECELILFTLAHHYGCRTSAANVLGISIRTLRNKIHEYESLGIAVPFPGEHGSLGMH